MLVAVFSMVIGWCSCWAARWLWNGGSRSTPSPPPPAVAPPPAPPPLDRDLDLLQKIFKKIAELEKVIKQLKSGSSESESCYNARCYYYYYLMSQVCLEIWHFMHRIPYVA